MKPFQKSSFLYIMWAKMNIDKRFWVTSWQRKAVGSSLPPHRKHKKQQTQPCTCNGHFIKIAFVFLKIWTKSLSSKWCPLHSSSCVCVYLNSIKIFCPRTGNLVFWNVICWPSKILHFDCPSCSTLNQETLKITFQFSIPNRSTYISPL